jgi:hypothetical protein
MKKPLSAHHKNRLFIVVSWIAIAFITISSAIIIFWLLYPYKVSSIDVPINIVNKDNQVQLGHSIIQELKIDKPNNIPPTNATRVLICDNGELVTLAPIPSALNLPIGTYTLINDRYILPKQVPVGSMCSFVWTQDYKVNPIRSISVEWRSELFKVKE